MSKQSHAIASIRIYESPVKLKEPFVISLGSLAYANNVVVVITSSNGLKGFGECSPFQTIHGETMETCIVVGKLIGEKLIGLDPLDITSISALMDLIIFGNSSIKSAIDIALHDLAAQHAGLPLFAFLGGRKSKTIQTDYTISLGSPEKMAQDGLSIVSNGFTVIKVKLGGSPEEDEERILQIRNAVGMEIPIRIDANQGWKPDQALSTLRTLSKYNIQHCEEPIPRWAFDKLPEIKSLSPIPIMADESCCDDHDAARLISAGACHLLNVKLGKSGGITKALKIIAIAEKAGMLLQMGGFLESRLGFTASAHFALCSENISFFDFDTPLMFEKDPVSGGITYGKAGIIKVPETPGLGASMDERYLNSLECILIS